jgi:hypothetical protein
VTDSSVRVRVVMDGSGYVLCAAYLAPNVSSSSLASAFTNELLLSSGVSPVAGDSFLSPFPSPSHYPPSATLALYELVGLVPSSSYNVYCASLSPTAVLMPTPDMLRSKMTVQTACCRLLSVRLARVVVDDMSVLGFALSLELDVGSQSVGELLKVSVSGVEVTSSMVQEMFTPFLVSFSPSSSSLKTSLTYIPVPSGSYCLNVTLSGPAEESYRVVFPAGDVLVVKSAEDPLSPPSVQRSEFL